MYVRNHVGGHINLKRQTSQQKQVWGLCDLKLRWNLFFHDASNKCHKLWHNHLTLIDIMPVWRDRQRGGWGGEYWMKREITRRKDLDGEWGCGTMHGGKPQLQKEIMKYTFMLWSQWWTKQRQRPRESENCRGVAAERDRRRKGNWGLGSDKRSKGRLAERDNEWKQSRVG